MSSSEKPGKPVSVKASGPTSAAQTHDDRRIIDSWHRNSEPWTEAVRKGEIASRVLVTNRAIIEAVLERSPRRVLDIGCGEGWLARELAAHGIDVRGVDIVADLIGRAQAGGGGRFDVVSHEAIADGAIEERFDICICNFSLLGDTSVTRLFAAIPSLLESGGAFIVQTIHPLMGCGEQPYRDGWREGSWTGFSSDFTDPPPWYFRTLETWVKMYADAGLHLVELREPVHPASGKPASVIMIGVRLDIDRR
jgi:2-polyprenyl-3-methyl-5-hydroxy-6-metoxy-1,4-benzoquinol methylase